MMPTFCSRQAQNATGSFRPDDGKWVNVGNRRSFYLGYFLGGKRNAYVQVKSPSSKEIKAVRRIAHAAVLARE